MKKILCIDDEPRILRILQHMLSREGYEVLTASDPRDTIRLIEDEQPDLLVLDVEMPGISGLEVFDRLKARFRDCPVLFATGYPEAFHLESEEKSRRFHEGFADGLTDILYKPFRQEEVSAKVDAMIGPGISIS